MSSKMIDFSPELGELLEFISNVAIAIRMNSAYAPPALRSPHVEQDVMWLSSCLHNLNSLGATMAERIPSQIVMACDSLIKEYEFNLKPGTNCFNEEPKPSFDRHEEYFDLQRGIDIFKKIRQKAS